MSACADLHYRQLAARLQEQLIERDELIAALQARIAELEAPNATVKADLTATLPIVAQRHAEQMDEYGYD